MVKDPSSATYIILQHFTHETVKLGLPVSSGFLFYSAIENISNMCHNNVS